MDQEILLPLAMMNIHCQFGITINLKDEVKHFAPDTHRAMEVATVLRDKFTAESMPKKCLTRRSFEVPLAQH